jgi:hypothetical protein
MSFIGSAPIGEAGCFCVKCSHVVICLMSCINVCVCVFCLFWYHTRIGHAVNGISVEFLNRNAQAYWDIIGFARYRFSEKKK